MKIDGRMKVKSLKAQFKREFGLTLRVYDGRSFADDEATLASIRKGDSKGGEFTPRKNTKVGNFEDKILELFGIKTQVAGSDDSYLSDNDVTLAKALVDDAKKLEKREQKKAKKTSDSQSEDDDSDAFDDEFEELDDDAFDSLSNESADRAQELIEEGELDEARELLEQAEGEAVESQEKYYVATVIANLPEKEDKNWAMDLFKEAYEESDEFDDMVEIAVYVYYENLDKEWSITVLKELENREDDPASYLTLAQCVFVEFDDAGWAKNLVEKAKNLIVEDSDDYEWLSERMIEIEKMVCKSE